MSLIGTLAQDLRSKYPSGFDGNEARRTRAGAYAMFLAHTASRPIFDAETLSNITTGYGNNITVPVLDAKTVTVGTPYTRTCAIADSENDSALLTLLFNSYGFRFSMTPSTHANNEVAYQADFTRKLEDYDEEFTKVLDSLCISQLETDKNIYFPAALTDYYAQIGNALQVPQASKQDFYNNVESILSTMDFYKSANIVSSTKHMALIRDYAKQGASNDVNDAWKFNGSGSSNDGKSIRPFGFYPTNRLANGAGVESAAFIVEEGSTFIYNRNDHDSRAGHNIGHKVWGEETLPISGMKMGTFYQEDCADRSAIAGGATVGNTRSLLEGFEFSTDVVTATKYNSSLATRYNPIIKAEITTI